MFYVLELPSTLDPGNFEKPFHMANSLVHFAQLIVESMPRSFKMTRQ